MRRFCLVLALAATAVSAAAGPASAATPPNPMTTLVPVPVTVQPAAGVTFTINSNTKVYAQSGATNVADSLTAILRRSTGFALPVVAAPAGNPASGISLLLTGADGSVGDQGYQLDAAARTLVLRARTPAGLFAGVQTLRQLLPAAVESSSVRPGPWTVPGGHIVDHPRYAYRGAMLDVARHFFSVAQVKRYLDQAALNKINYLHLHLADDQGWRLMINSWPRLATYGGGTAVGGDPGGYYTQAQYSDLVAYAQQRFITIVPEIDMPGHTNAALASYAELNCDGVAPPRYTGTDVGFSSLCVGKEITYTFLDNVIGELAALTPGAYLHIGGDEAQSTTPADYATFVNRVQGIAKAHGKIAIGWHDVVHATPLPDTVAQYWDTTTTNPAVANAAAHGTKIIMSPANKAYLDMKYTNSTPLGQDWAGLIEVKTAYGWNPGAYLHGVRESAVLGVEAPLWTETLRTSGDLEYMAFPRMAALAELGWSPQSTHDWTGFKGRLGRQAPRWNVLGIGFYRSPQVNWS